MHSVRNLSAYPHHSHMHSYLVYFICKYTIVWMSRCKIIGLVNSFTSVDFPLVNSPYKTWHRTASPEAGLGGEAAVCWMEHKATVNRGGDGAPVDWLNYSNSTVVLPTSSCSNLCHWEIILRTMLRAILISARPASLSWSKDSGLG